MKKVAVYIFSYIFFSLIVLPVLITGLFGFKSMSYNENYFDNNNSNIEVVGKGNTIKVLNPETSQVIETDFEEYIKGVVGAEMPALFEEEALKAQAVAARTYAIRKINETDTQFNSEETPYNIGQAYMTKEELKKKWGNNFSEYYAKVSEAVDSTNDEIMVYNDEPILAVFHSTSGGYTENAENVWETEVPYLKSVESVQDENAPDFEASTALPANTVIAKLQSKYNDLLLTEANLIEQIQIVERSEAGYVLKVQIGNKILSGKDIREVLGLRSTNFYVRQDGDSIIFTTKGYGHGAGMSQYGANFMAKDGYNYEEILKHYYQGINIVKRSK